MLYELRVLTGLHRGAALPLSGAEWSIGSSSDADLALYDTGIKHRHCLLRLVDSTWSLTGQEGVVTDNEGHRVEAIATLQPDTPFALNGVWLSVVSANTDWLEDETVTAEQAPPDKPTIVSEQPDGSQEQPELLSMNAQRDETTYPQPRRQPPSLIASVLMISGLALFLGILLWAFNRQAPVPAAPPPATKVKLADAQEVRKVVLKMLQQRDLQNRITLTEEPGKILLHGNFAEDDLLQLTERMLLRFERQYQSPIQVQSALPVATPILPFTVAQISNGRLAHIVTNDGRRLFLGDEVDGMRLVEINDHRVIFEGERRVELSW
ncbi:FHA domain-containing protein [Pseudomonas sp. FP1742]|uniref:FHA domain-containing protein n=1 Tax=Pseudomonas sp. FP1742 TaxID=2954079 RepID=UPI0027347218|nr:FHA domain-containing protein [Pseudomonas sp. FP1742]WLG48091.1 FHA domain-containing protein [Pseudomonas sp. FP1742]